MAPPSSSPPPPHVAEAAFLRRVFPFILVANYAVGVYMLLTTSKKDSAKKAPAEPVETTKSVLPDKKPEGSVPAPVKVLPPIPEQEQLELFQWVLEEEESQANKPTDKTKKKKIHEEKALLKQYIQAKSVPSI
ncbi:hypothetical protein Cni_G07881 [Canna indica]|uniref:Uncharacterized protein n=1 Tax=Canna indica TaxID=4628 RepID=A0AAQ3JZB1_9LILI|nr:hypothetical protein Cni_G07881 [Canna indica]